MHFRCHFSEIAASLGVTRLKMKMSTTAHLSHCVILPKIRPVQRHQCDYTFWGQHFRPQIRNSMQSLLPLCFVVFDDAKKRSWSLYLLQCHHQQSGPNSREKRDTRIVYLKAHVSRKIFQPQDNNRSKIEFSGDALSAKSLFQVAEWSGDHFPSRICWVLVSLLSVCSLCRLVLSFTWQVLRSIWVLSRKSHKMSK